MAAENCVTEATQSVGGRLTNRFPAGKPFVAEYCSRMKFLPTGAPISLWSPPTKKAARAAFFVGEMGVASP
jgi:hypothetical protein